MQRPKPPEEFVDQYKYYIHRIKYNGEEHGSPSSPEVYARYHDDMIKYLESKIEELEDRVNKLEGLGRN